MKKILLGLTICFTLFAGVANASFPVVNKTEVSTTTSSNTASETTVAPSKTTKAEDVKSKKTTEKKNADQELLITLLLWFFLGGLAAHRWYKGKPAGYNILFILTAGGCGIWALIDLINILTGKF